MSDVRWQRLNEAARVLESRLPEIPRVALILGSGLSDALGNPGEGVSIPWEEIPGFPLPTVAGHAGAFWAGRIGDVPLLFDQVPITMPSMRKRALFVAVVPRADATGERTVRVIKTELIGPPLGKRSKMPLPNQARLVTDLLQRPRQRHGVGGKCQGVRWRRDSKSTPVTTGQ